MPIASANSIKLFYDEFGNRSAPAILLITGFGAQMIEWPKTFCEGLAKRGFRVIRFDNRDVGLSTKLDGGTPVDVAAAFARATSGQPIEAPYVLEDMARDAIGLLDALGIERAHVVGASMGGMIAQIIAAEYKERVMSVVKVFETASSAVQGRLWLVWLMTLSGLPLVLQAALCDGLAFDPFSLQQDCLAASEVDVGRG